MLTSDRIFRVKVHLEELLMSLTTVVLCLAETTKVRGSIQVELLVLLVVGADQVCFNDLDEFNGVLRECEASPALERTKIDPGEQVAPLSPGDGTDSVRRATHLGPVNISTASSTSRVHSLFFSLYIAKTASSPVNCSKGSNNRIIKNRNESV